ncbi:MAG: 16S rRNA (cytidine(1402)-2'-O)-methyltransferase [Candidatus Shapirobacteria bacterium]|jgi:16S rRNA (cytidine1402-2'-O)-methyltransferase
MLYIIATPIGNLKDITLRALETLEKVEILLCEDTRICGNLLVKLGVRNKPKLVSYYDDIEERRVAEAVGWLREGREIGLITCKGTPIISDPGWLLVKRCRELQLPLTSVPGPSAVVNAIVLAGLPAGRFVFLGFLPKKAGERKKILERYKEFDGAKVVFESPFRLQRLIEEIKAVYKGEVKLKICREMTKVYEEVKDDWDGEARGETVVVFL